jgi:putative aldouronate transport system permease protein
MKIKRSVGEVIFDTINIIAMVLVMFVTLYPIWFVLISSFSDANAVAEGRTMLLPVFGEGQFINIAAYKEAFAYHEGIIITAYGNTILYSVVGTLISMLLTILGAYPLSKKRLKGRMFFTMIMLFSMWFSAGMVPTYHNLMTLGLLGTRIGLMTGFAIAAFYVVLIRTYFQSISDSLEESAKMDGAHDLLILFKIYIPLAVPAIMTVSLYYFVSKWNAYIWSQIFFARDMYKQPLQVILKKLVVDRQMASESVPGMDVQATTSETVIYATIMLATVPMIVIYPFVQKFFVKGIMVGSVKG